MAPSICQDGVLNARHRSLSNFYGRSERRWRFAFYCCFSTEGLLYLCHELVARSIDYLLLPLPYSLVTGRETDLASSPSQDYYSVLPQHFASRRSTALRFVHTAHSNTCSPSLAVYVIFNHTSHAVSCLFEASANRFESKAPKRDRQVPPCQRKKGLQWM